MFQQYFLKPAYLQFQMPQPSYLGFGGLIGVIFLLALNLKGLILFVSVGM